MNNLPEKLSTKPQIINSFLAITTFGLFALFSTFVRLSREEVAVVTVAFVRFTGGTILLLIWILRKHSWQYLRPNKHIPLIILRVFFGWLSFSTFTYAASRLSVSDMVALQFSIPLLLAVAAHYLLGESLPLLRKIAIGIGVVGILLVAHPGGTKEPFIIGIALLACVLAATSDICVKILARSTAPELIALYFLIAGSLISTVWLYYSPQPIPTVTTSIYLGGIAVTGAIAQVLLGVVFSRMPASAVAPFAYTSYVWSLLFDCSIWGIYPDFLGTLGAICIMGDGVLAYFSLGPTPQIKNSHQEGEKE